MPTTILKQFSRVTGLLSVAVFFLIQATTDAQTETPLENPSLAIGLNGVADWSTQHPFIDLMKTARPWIGHLPGQHGGVDYEVLKASGLIDPQGWPISAPRGIEALETYILTDQPADAKGLAGRYLLTYEGIGRVQVTGPVSQLRYGKGEIRFNYEPGDGLVGVRVSRVDPTGSGNHIRNIRVMREDHIQLYELGLRFNPDWLRHISDMRVLRFMDWMGTNNSRQTVWDDRPKVEDFSYADYVRGVPVEIMVELANEVGADPWFTLPHLVDDDYIRRFATYVRDHLDTNLKAYVEYSNEVWNWQFEQAHWAEEQAAKRWGEGGDGWVQFGGMRAAEMARIWSEVFGEHNAQRLVRVISPQTGWLGLEHGLLNAPNFLAEDDTHRPPFEDFDAYAVTGYFNLEGDSDEAAQRVLSWLEKGEDHATDRLLKHLAETSVDALVNNYFPYHADVAAQHGLQFIMYEGGTHVVGRGDWVNNRQLTDFYTRFNYTEEIAKLYQMIFDGWQSAGGTLFTAYHDVATPSKWGSWGHLRHLDDINPRWTALMSYNASRPVTWETRAPETFNNGTIRKADEEGGKTLAQQPRDILLGGPGDDTLIANGCCTRMHGGEGTNTAVLPGKASDYTLKWDKNTLLAVSEQGEARLISMQKILFSAETTLGIDLQIGVQP